MTDDPDDIDNWRRLDRRLTTSGQPTEAQLAVLKAIGVRQVINLGLHTHEKALADEAASLARLGVGYRHLPVNFQQPTRADLDAFYAAMEEFSGAILHVHCIANYRVSAFVYRYRIDRLGWDKARARVDLEAIWRPTGAWAVLVDPQLGGQDGGT
jgi:protein tyrosine phosphatase (PTP) superfamily phosphohydrolase (DUF442 family)